jgi:CO/xanthine dehydrogenase FAD-binding subunit
VRANVADYELRTPSSLGDVLQSIAEQPGVWTPIAGGTELMVQLSAGRLPQKKLISIWNLPELRAFSADANALTIGAGRTYTDIRRSEIVAAEFPLLSRAASWTGGIANQNRGTLGGNIVNASPAADSLPALLVYDAELELISVRGRRRVPYSNFHLGYKRTLLAADELIIAVHLPRKFANYFHYSRKIGARNAQAISKLALAAVARFEGGLIRDVRIAAASLIDKPMRCAATEAALIDRPIDSQAIAGARAALLQEIKPIDDIRSTASYRAKVAANLLEEFLNALAAHGASA